MVFGSAILFVPSAEAKTADVSSGTIELNASPQRYEQRRWNQRQRWNRRGVRVVNRTRIVRRGYRTYRETIQTRYLPNGRTQTRVISRVRIR